MNYKINCNKLKNIKDKSFVIVVFIFVLLLVSFVLSISINYSKTKQFYAIYNNNVIVFKINYELSDILKSNKTITVNDKILQYSKIAFGDYEFIDNNLYQLIYITVENVFDNNEIVNVKIYYDKKKIIYHVLDLIK